MISVAPIVPTAYLQKVCSNATTQLALAHQVIRDDAYRRFYKHQKAHVILDNSAFELGQAVSDGTILETMGLIQPDEVVLPDVLQDHEGTIARVRSFLGNVPRFTKQEAIFMAVPHGKTLAEYIECYIQLAAMPEVAVLGIGTIYNRIFEGGRRAIFRALKVRSQLADKPHHLLGLGDSGHFELQMLKEYDVIRSCDSSAAYMQASRGARIAADVPYEKIRGHVVFTDPYNEDVAQLTAANLRTLQKAAQ